MSLRGYKHAASCLPSALREPRVYLSRHAPIAALFRFKRFICTLYHPRLASRKIERLNSYTRRVSCRSRERLFIRAVHDGGHTCFEQRGDISRERVCVSSCPTREITLTVSLLRLKKEREREREREKRQRFEGNP